ncbi:nuclear transport factor 2 family protein [Flavihumibacter rivuli]|uniref:nuclear transport factor 2 family protein n=1 Tax=Flavihumibacter rivuli TaxID=2838156 RepID=UPI001BDEC2A6|nr:nuclear transport factor 2 family protein [Flavihumibacter rivuli]ULQ58351.1 nuclear transport factor 2 family protein [Flavihumibacter rivuli]
MKKLFLIIVLFVVGSGAFAQADSVSLKDAVMRLNQALVNKDSSALRALLHNKCSYGHSNGWIETKEEAIADMFNGVLTYHKIDQGPLKVTIEEETGIVRTDVSVNVTRNGQNNDFKLHVLQVWVYKKKKGWQLLGRQTTRI